MKTTQEQRDDLRRLLCREIVSVNRKDCKEYAEYLAPDLLDDVDTLLKRAEQAERQAHWLAGYLAYITVWAPEMQCPQYWLDESLEKSL